MAKIALVAASPVLTWHSVHSQEADGANHLGHLVPLFPAAEDGRRQGFVRVVNHADRPGEVKIVATDDEGTRFGPTSLAISADETVHFNSTDLEQGNAAKGLADGIGSGTGDWWLTLSSGLDIEVLSYIRTPMDGFLTSMHDLVPVGEDGRHRVAVFNPGSNVDQVSLLRVINPGEGTAHLTVSGTDGKGDPGLDDVQFTVPPRAVRTFDAQELEAGGAGFEGSLGDGDGKWQLSVEADGPLYAMSLLSSPTGHLSNLSAAPANVEGDVHTVPLFPAASDPQRRQGFVRVINHSQASGEVTINAHDDTDRDFGTSTLTLGAAETVHFNSDDLETGNPAKGLTGGSGAGDGDWRLTLASGLDIEVLAYIRTAGGFLTTMHDTVAREGNRHRVATFNPGANVNQASELRLVNAGNAPTEVVIAGIDGRGDHSSGSVSVSVPAGASRTLTAQELEAGGDGIEGELGEGAGKWQLIVESHEPITVMSLLSSPTGHLTNLSTAPALDFAPVDSTAFEDRAAGRRIVGGHPADPLGFLPDDRFRESRGSETYEGTYTYTRTGRNRATLKFEYDAGESCNYELAFQSRTAGTLSYTCEDGGSGERSWRFVVGTMPTGLWSPDRVHRGSFSFSKGVATIHLDEGGFAEEGGHRYLCVSALGCEIEDGLAKSGRIVDTRTARETDLLAGVAEIDAPGVPGQMCAFGPASFPVVVAPTWVADVPTVVAGAWEAGRVVAFGHTGYLERSALVTADTGRMVTNALQWSSGGRQLPRIGVVNAPELRTWLTAAGYSVVDLALTTAALGTVDVVAVWLRDQSDAELEALSAFIRSGGGLVAVSLGWSYAQTNPGMGLQTDHAGNRLLASMGIAWGLDYVQETSPSGFATDEPPDRLTHAAKAFEALKAHEAGTHVLSERDLAQAAYSVEEAVFRCMPSDDELLRPDLVAWAEDYEGWPTEQQPVGTTDFAARFSIRLFSEGQRSTPAGAVRAHPAAADFPGPVPADAPRLSRTVEIDAGVPRWHSTGLYAAPGEVVTVTMSADAASTGGVHVRVGAHSDRNYGRDKWTRMPEISRRFAVSATTTPVANAFGGLIYVEVPPASGLGRIDVDIDGAVAAPRFVFGETDTDAWRDEIRHAPAPWAEIEGRNMIVTTESRIVRALDDPAAVARTWDRIVELTVELATGPAVARPERFVVDRQISVGYMHAGYPIMAHLDQSANLADVEHLSTEGNWGFFHEVGHNWQNRDWVFNGSVEVSVNLFTYYIYEFLCGFPVAENRQHSQGSPEARAEKIADFDFDAPAAEKWAKWKSDYFLALIMYVQIQQAFGWDAYKRVFAAYRALADEERPQSDDEKRDQWLQRLSREVEYNLGPFFEAWGVPTSQEARDSIADLPTWFPDNFPPSTSS